MEETSNSKEALDRTLMYREQSVRKKAQKVISTEHSLAPLKIKVTAQLAVESDLDRIVELLHRTNQFNCTGKKYSKAELIPMLTSKLWQVWKFEMSDKFGDIGCVGSVIINKKISAKTVVFDSFVMSCRAMGYGLEQYMVIKLLEFYSGWHFIGIYNPSNKNTPCKSLYAELNFIYKKLPEEWHLSATKCLPHKPSWINKRTD